MSKRRSRKKRRGYAMLTVLVFLAVMLTLVGVSQRHLASVLRVEQARLQAADRDEGPIVAMGRALALLETGLPPTDPYECKTTVSTSQGSRTFTVTYSSDGFGQWTVEAAPTSGSENPPAMPSTFD